MKFLFCLLSLFLISETMVLFDFDTKSNLQNWMVVDDVVMGGRSGGQFAVNAAGHGEFSGYVSLENNGGFSSIRHRFAQKEITPYSKVIIRVKGDGKRYQFRVKTDAYDRHSYITNFETTGEWQTVEITLAEMYPTFRGRTLSMSNYPGEKLNELAFLISNKKAESFQLEIDKIELQ